MKKREFKSLVLNKKSISDLENKKGGAVDTIIGCANTGCVGEPKHTCGIINCDLTKDWDAR